MVKQITNSYLVELFENKDKIQKEYDELQNQLEKIEVKIDEISGNLEWVSEVTDVVDGIALAIYKDWFPHRYRTALAYIVGKKNVRDKRGADVYPHPDLNTQHRKDRRWCVKLVTDADYTMRTYRVSSSGGKGEILVGFNSNEKLNLHDADVVAKNWLIYGKKPRFDDKGKLVLQ